MNLNGFVMFGITFQTLVYRVQFKGKEGIYCGSLIMKFLYSFVAHVVSRRTHGKFIAEFRPWLSGLAFAAHL